MRTWREAALSALRGAGPLRVEEITDRIRSEQLRELTGNTPIATVAAQLYLAIQDNDPRVRLVATGVFEHTGILREDISQRSLGRLEFINPRDVWPDEARHFTPWLLDNADYLEQVLGIDIELERSEHPVGPFSLDLFGRDITNGCKLIIENQLEITDHRHLGQLLTYAAGTDGLTIVWVAPAFRDEHRDALDYLNKISVGEARFFGVKLRVAVIGDSDPAPDLELVSQPSDWRAQVKTQRTSAESRSDGELSESRHAYLSFWTQYLERLHAQHPGITNVRTPPAKNWLTLNYARRLNITGAFVSTGEVRCELYIDTGSEEVNHQLFDALEQHRGEIEQMVGSELLWDRLEGRRSCRISLAKPGRAIDDDITPHLEWLMDSHLKFRAAFFPLIHKLPADLWNEP